MLCRSAQRFQHQGIILIAVHIIQSLICAVDVKGEVCKFLSQGIGFNGSAPFGSDDYSLLAITDDLGCNHGSPKVARHRNANGDFRWGALSLLPLQ